MKQKIQVLIPLVILAAMLIYCWTIFLTTDWIATWRHYLGLILFLVTFILFFKNLRLATFMLGIYLLLATFNFLALTAAIKTSWLRIGPISTPPVQLLSLGLFILYFSLNFNGMIEHYLDYKEVDKKKPSGKPHQTQ